MTVAFVGQFHFLLVKALVTFDCCNLMHLTEKGERVPVGTVSNVTFKTELKKPYRSYREMSSSPANVDP